MDSGKQRSIIHVDMDAFYASVEQLDEPRHAGQPVIVGGLGGRGVVAAASYEARAFGVHSAMPMARARRLCPQAVFLRSRMDRYRAVSKAVFAVFAEFTPQVEGLSLDEAFLDVTHSTLLMGDAERIGRLLQQRVLEATGLVASVGVAPNKFLAKLASDARKPAGFLHVDADRVSGFLDPMPVTRLWGIGKKTAPRLRRIGILTIGQLRRADPETLRGVLGHRTHHFLQLSRGEDDRPVRPQRPEKSISHEVTFDRDLRDPREMRAELQRQAEMVMRRVRSKGLAARTVTLKIRDHRFDTVTRATTLRAPTRTTRTVFRLASALLAAWWREHENTPVRLLGVGVSKLELMDQASKDLDQALDLISDRFGPDAVTGGLALARRPRR